LEAAACRRHFDEHIIITSHITLQLYFNSTQIHLFAAFADIIPQHIDT